MKRPEKCFQCVQVWARHENVLQFKVGECVKKKNNNRHLRCNFPENLPMETLLKLNGSNTPCPFSGAYNFTYKKDGKECNSPSSEIVKCMNPSQSLFKFEVCPDDVEEDAGGNVFYNTIIGLDGDSQETLTCKATWDNDLNDKETFMMGTFDYRYKRTDQERVRCFLVQETKRGIQIAQSSDGTCYNNLRSSQSGYRTMKLDKVTMVANLATSILGQHVNTQKSCSCHLKFCNSVQMYKQIMLLKTEQCLGKIICSISTILLLILVMD